MTRLERAAPREAHLLPALLRERPDLVVDETRAHLHAQDLCK